MDTDYCYQNLHTLLVWFPAVNICGPIKHKLNWRFAMCLLTYLVTSVGIHVSHTFKQNNINEVLLVVLLLLKIYLQNISKKYFK